MLEYILAFVVGSLIGSFLNVVGIRVPIKKSIVKPNSHCFKCKEEVKRYDLIPILSYFLLKGKCRNCKTKLSLIYPIFELLTGLAFVLSYYFSENIEQLIFNCILVSIMMALTVADLEYRLVPDSIIWFSALTVVPLGILVNEFDWVSSIFGGVGAFLFFLILAIVSKGGMGGGDIKLIGILGLTLGFENVVIVILISSIIGTLYGFVTRIINEKNKSLPFVPFMAVGVLVVQFYGVEIWNFLTAY